MISLGAVQQTTPSPDRFMVPIVALLAVLFASYWQTIRAYPSNGGAYIRSKTKTLGNALAWRAPRLQAGTGRETWTAYVRRYRSRSCRRSARRRGLGDVSLSLGLKENGPSKRSVPSVDVTKAQAHCMPTDVISSRQALHSRVIIQGVYCLIRIKEFFRHQN